MLAGTPVAAEGAALEKAAERGTRSRKRKSDSASEVYCLCSKPYSADEDYLGCETCGGWFHLHCVGESSLEAWEGRDYVCPKCRTGSAVFMGVSSIGNPAALLQTAVRFFSSLSGAPATAAAEANAKIKAGKISSLDRLGALFESAAQQSQAKEADTAVARFLTEIPKRLEKLQRAYSGNPRPVREMLRKIRVCPGPILNI
jgi:hypothetical protein